MVGIAGNGGKLLANIFVSGLLEASVMLLLLPHRWSLGTGQQSCMSDLVFRLLTCGSEGRRISLLHLHTAST